MSKRSMKNITDETVTIDANHLTVAENRNYTGEVEDIRLKSSSLPGLLNPNLPKELSRATYIATIKQVVRLVKKGKVPEAYQNIELPEKNFRLLSFNFVCLVSVAISYKSNMIAQDKNPRQRELTEISKVMVELYLNRVGLYSAIIAMFYHKAADGGTLYLGKSFPFYFGEEGLKCHRSSFYNWSKLNPQLPKFQNSRLYTESEFDQWRQFLKTKIGRQLFVAKI